MSQSFTEDALSPTELEACQEAQADELLALQAILPAGALIVPVASSSRITLRLHPSLSQSTTIRVRSLLSGCESTQPIPRDEASSQSGDIASSNTSQPTTLSLQLDSRSAKQQPNDVVDCSATGSANELSRVAHGDGPGAALPSRRRWTKGGRRRKGMRDETRVSDPISSGDSHREGMEDAESATSGDSGVALSLQSMQLSGSEKASGRTLKARTPKLDPTSPPFKTGAAGASLYKASAIARPSIITDTAPSADLGAAAPVLSSAPPDPTPASDTSGSRLLSEECIQATHLPPVQLHVRLPASYPFHQAPVVEQITAAWLGQPSSGSSIESDPICRWLSSELAVIWEESRAEVLYAWSEWLREGLWSSEDLGPFNDDQADLLFTEHLEPHQHLRLASVLVSHNTRAAETAFEGERYACGICLEERPGVKCFRLRHCEHVFCKECLRDYLGSMIEEGYHRQAGSCPDPECTQARVQLEKRTQADGAQKQEQSSIGSITDAELLLLVGEKQLGRLSWLRQKATAEADPTAAHCPRQGCQAIVVKNKADEGTAYETMRECHACGFCWCAWCNRTWHGRAPCQLSTSVALIEEYMSYEAGSEGATKMELRYGRSNLQRLVKEETERQANEAWLDSNAKKCPTCHVRIELSFGCNHMTCVNCRAHFCFRCSERLNPLEPYRHFNTPGKDCYQKLFPFAPGALDGIVHEAPPIHQEDAFPPIDPRDIDAWEREEFGLDNL